MIDVQIETLPDTVSNAFHGTTLQYAVIIEKEGFKHGQGSRPFLGYGVYFFRGDQKAAFRWAHEKYKGQDVAVLRATVCYGTCLSLFIEDHRRLLVRIEEHIKSKQEGPITLAQAIDFLAAWRAQDHLTQIETVDAPQIESRSIVTPKHFADSRVWVFAKHLICVRELGNIRSHSIVYVQ